MYVCVYHFPSWGSRDPRASLVCLGTWGKFSMRYRTGRLFPPRCAVVSSCRPTAPSWSCHTTLETTVSSLNYKLNSCLFGTWLAQKKQKTVADERYFIQNKVKQFFRIMTDVVLYDTQQQTTACAGQFCASGGCMTTYLLSLFCSCDRGWHRLALQAHAGSEFAIQTWSGARCERWRRGICWCHLGCHKKYHLVNTLYIYLCI